MNEKEFINELKKNLKKLSKEDRDEIIEDYKEHFEIGKEEKRKESEIAKSLGNPKQLAKQVNANFLIKQAENKKSFANIGRAIFATLGLGFFNLVFVLGIFLGLVGILIGLYAITLGLIVAGLASIIAPFIAPFSQYISIGTSPFAVIFLGIGFIALGVLTFIGNWYVTKGFYYIIIKYLKMNISIIKGEQLK